MFLFCLSMGCDYSLLLHRPVCMSRCVSSGMHTAAASLHPLSIDRNNHQPTMAVPIAGRSRVAERAAVNQRRPTHHNARADHLEADVSTFCPSPALHTDSLSLGANCIVVASRHAGSLSREEFCLSSISYYRKVPLGCCISCVGLTPTIERNNKQTQSSPRLPSRRPKPSWSHSPTFLHSKSAMRTALPHLLPCTQHIVRRYATTATSGSTCSSPQHHATARLLLPSCTYSPAAQRYTAGDASAAQGKDVRFLSRNVLALLDVRGLRMMHPPCIRRRAVLNIAASTLLTTTTSTGVKAVSHDSTPRLPAMSRTELDLPAKSVHDMFKAKRPCVKKHKPRQLF
jgi:hypothetical protein